MADSSSSSSSSSSCVPGEVSVHLQQWGQSDFVYNRHRGFRLRVVASGACGMQNEIFRYTVVRTNSQSGENEYELSGVCTWPDMEQYPRYTPDPEQDPQVVRLDYIDVIVDTESQAEDAWETIQEEVASLVRSIVAGQTLVAGAAVDISGGA